MLLFRGFGGRSGRHSVGSVGAVGEVRHDARLACGGIYYGGSLGRLWSFSCGEHVVEERKVLFVLGMYLDFQCNNLGRGGDMTL